jgi:hypothetical protein
MNPKRQKEPWRIWLVEMAIPAGGTVQAGDYCCCWKQRVLETAAVLPASPAISDHPKGTAGGTGGTRAAGAARRLHGRGATAAGGPEVRSRRASLRAGGPVAPAQHGVRRRHAPQPLHLLSKLLIQLINENGIWQQVLKKRGPGVKRPSPYFIKRKRPRHLRPRKNSPNPGPCPQSPCLVASTARGIFLPLQCLPGNPSPAEIEPRPAGRGALLNAPSQVRGEAVCATSS